MLIPVEPWVRDRAHHAENPVTPKDAATIAVVRDGEQGLEVFLMRRQASMAFAAGMYVFPGGGVHEPDSQAIAWVGPDASQFANRFNTSPELAHSLVVAAVRETFEETGVLLAGPNEFEVVRDVSQYHDVRLALERHETTFTEFVSDAGLMLRADLLGAWSHWITPTYEPRRYDTKFFVAALPEGQQIDAVSGEAEHSLWVPISEVLQQVERGEVAMMPPTSHTCRQLQRETSATVLQTAQARMIQTIEPVLVEVNGELFIETGVDDFS